MKFFIDTADIEQIREAAALGVIHGVTTNPSLIAKTGRKHREVIEEICDIVDGDISVEATALDAEGMIAEGREFATWGDSIVVKVPLTPEGITACKALSDDGIGVNVTLCFSMNQALLAANAGAKYISPFIGRLDDIGQDGMETVAEIVAAYANYPHIDTQVLAASIRHPRHVSEAALVGAHVATIPHKVLMQMFNHSLTDIGIERFLADWEKVPKE
jgi:transaldolase